MLEERDDVSEASPLLTSYLWYLISSLLEF